jgi:hypothetical protein
VTRRRSVLLGAAVIAAYLVAVTVTVALRPNDARPLYDGFTAPSSYRFVDPPPFFASGNVTPKPMSTSIALGPDGSEPTGFSTPDGQFVVSLGAGAIPPAGDATSVAVRVTPLAPHGLPPVPGGLRANGNAYRVEMTYEPTGARIARFGKPGSLLIEIPELGTTLFRSVVAATWSPLPARTIPPRELSLSARFETPGDYLAATNLPVLAAPPGRSGRGATALGIATALGAGILFAAAYIAIARRRRRNAPG